MVAAVADREETDGAGALVVDRDGADRVGALHREEVDVAGDVDDALVRAVTVVEVGGRDRADEGPGEVQRAAVDEGVAGIGVVSGKRQRAVADLGEAERGQATVTDLAREDGALVVTSDRQGDGRQRVGVLDETDAGEAADGVVEAVEAQDGRDGALGREDVGGIKAEGVGHARGQHHAGEGRAARVGVEAGEDQRRAGQAGDEEVVARGAGNGAGDGEGRTIGAGAGDGPGLRSAEHERGADQHGAGIVLDRDALGGARRGDGEGRGGLRAALGDGDVGHARRGGSEAQGADGEIAVERGHVSGGRRARRGAEDDVVGLAGEALGVDEAGRVRREVRIEVGVVERRPADVGADAPVEVGREGRRGERDGGVGAGEREGVPAEGADLTQGVGRAGETAGGGEQVVAAGGEAVESGQVDDDAVRGDGGGRRADAVIAGEGADVEAERGGTGRAGAEVEDARAEGDGLSDGVVEVEDRTGADLHGGRAQGGGLAAGDVQATAEDGRLADIGKEGTGQRQGADAGLDDADVVLIDAHAADGALVNGGDVLVDGEVGDRRRAADDGVVADRTQATHEDRSRAAAAARDGDDRSEAGAIEARVGDGQAGDDAARDIGDDLRALGAHEPADGVEADDRGGGEALARIEDGDVRGLDAGDAGKRGDRLVGGAVRIAELEHA